MKSAGVKTINVLNKRVIDEMVEKAVGYAEKKEFTCVHKEVLEGESSFSVYSAPEGNIFVNGEYATAEELIEAFMDDDPDFLDEEMIEQIKDQGAEYYIVLEREFDGDSMVLDTIALEDLSSARKWIYDHVRDYMKEVWDMSLED